MFCFKIILEPEQFFNSFGFFVILCSLNGLQTIPTVETMNFRILCCIKILAPLLGWQNLDRTIAYTRFHRIKGGGEQFFNSFGFFVILCSLNGLQTIPTVETMNFRILCCIKILAPLLGWQNLDRTIAYTRFHRIKGGGGGGVLNKKVQKQNGKRKVLFQHEL